MFFFFFWDRNQHDLGLIDAKHCPHCGNMSTHHLIRDHKHLILTFIPLYISNKYYRLCQACGTLDPIDKKEAKQIDRLNKKYFPTEESWHHFISEIRDTIDESRVILNGKVNQDQLVFLKHELYQRFSSRYDYPKTFYDGWIDYFVHQMREEYYQESTKQPRMEASIEQRLKKLKDLRDAGLITEEEYSEKKSDILKNL